MIAAFGAFVIAELGPAIYRCANRMQTVGPMEASAKDRPYGDWRGKVDECLQEIYCITIEDAGFDEEYLLRHWQSNEMPHEFVEWFGNKYDLEPIGSLVRSHSRGR